MVALGGPDFGLGQRPRNVRGDRIYPSPSPVEVPRATGISRLGAREVGSLPLSAYFHDDRGSHLEDLVIAVDEQVAAEYPQPVSESVDAAAPQGAPAALTSASGSQADLYPNGSRGPSSANQPSGHEIVLFGTPDQTS